MEKYEFIKEIGEGSFGSVCRAINKLTGEIIAIKRIKGKCYSWDECLELREVRSLRRMSHPNIVKLKELICDNGVVFFVFEYMESNLYDVMKDRPLPESVIKKWCFQVLMGLAHMHQKGYFHRDLKPENLLVAQDNTIKIADLGLAREIGSEPPYTAVVGSLWYQAPELLIGSQFYDLKVDMWAMGATMAEMFTGRPLFPGSSEGDQLSRICQFMGINPSRHEAWPSEGLLHLDSEVQEDNVWLELLLPNNASGEAISLIKSLCSWDPRDRPTATEALQHPFFRDCLLRVPPLLCSGPIAAARGPPPGFESCCRPRPIVAARGPPPGFESKLERWPVAPPPPPPVVLNAGIWQHELLDLLIKQSRQVQPAARAYGNYEATDAAKIIGPRKKMAPPPLLEPISQVQLFQPCYPNFVC